MSDTDKRPLRRKDRAMPEAEAMALLERCEYGVLSTVGADGAPYGVPLSHVVMDGGICFHCARTGRKLENLDAENRVSYTVTGMAESLGGKEFAMYYESAVAFGTAAPVRDPGQRKAILLALCEKYSPGRREAALEEIRSSDHVTAVYRVEISHLTGKARKKPQ